MLYNKKIWNLQRYPNTSNRSLRAWSAADELLLKTIQPKLETEPSILLFNDMYGAMACALAQHKPTSVISLNSQLKATRINLKNNGLNPGDFKWDPILKMSSEKSDLVLLKIPKSADLFQLFLHQIHQNLKADSEVYCCFMTRNFTSKWLENAGLYFEEVNQSLAVKKSRLLILSKPKKELPKYAAFKPVTNELDLSLKQYAGVFSAGKVDIATQVFLKHLRTQPTGCKIMDLACGNGVIAADILKKNSDVNMHLVDDSYLAISSAKLNISKNDATFHWTNTIETINEKDFDLIVCNPPFHFEYENTIEISLDLFIQAKEALCETGKFMLVANTHLNYKTHLEKLFKKVEQLEVSGKFEVIECSN